MRGWCSPSRWLEGLASIPRSVIGFLLQPLPPPPPLLPVVAVDRHHMMRNLHNVQLGMSAFVLANGAAATLVFSDKFPAAQPLDFIIVGFMVAAALLWNGIVFAKIYVQAVGITLFLLCFYALIASFLPITFSFACCLSGAFCLLPFLYLLIKPQPVYA